MNIFRGSLNLYLGGIGLKGRNALRSQLNDYKFFSATNSIGVKNNKNTLNHKNDIFFESEDASFDSKTEEDINFFAKKSGNRNLIVSDEANDKYKINGNHRFDDDGSSYASENENSFNNSWENDFKSGKDLYCDRLTLDREQVFKFSDSCDNPVIKFLHKVLKMSAVLPDKSPVLKNHLCKCDPAHNGNFFFIQGFNFLWAAFVNRIEPFSIFYCHQNQILNLKFSPYIVEYYYISKLQMSKVLNSTDVLAIFNKDRIINLAVKKEKSLPVSIVVHNIQNVENIRGMVNDAAIFKCQRIISTYGSLRMYARNIIEQNEYKFFYIPIYDQFRWSEIESTIDSNIGIYLVGPNSEDPSKTRKKSNQLQCVDIFSTDFWTKDKILIINSGVTVEEDEELLKFCKNWNVKKLICTLTEDSCPPFTALMGEIQRQHYYKFVNNKKKPKDNESL